MNLISIFFNNFFAFIIILSIIVFVHEFGHYIVAKINKVKVDAFSIGFGKELCGFNDKSGTRWSISLIPFGGYVKFFGDEDASSSTVNKDKLDKLSAEDKKQCLYYQTPLVRLFVAIAGPLFNFILAFIILTFIYSFYGLVVSKPIITEILPNSAAEKYDLRANDEVLEINNDEIKTFEAIQMKILVNLDNEMTFKIKRNNEIIVKKIIPTIIEKQDIFKNKIKVSQIGILSNKIEHVKISFFEATNKAINQIYNVCTMTLKALGQMIIGRRGLDGLGGPIKIAQYSGEAFKNGFETVLSFIAMISISLGLMNLLPIPALDGGHILFCLIEILRRKPLSEKLENAFSYLGFGILISLMLFSTIKDIFDVICKFI